MFICKRTYLDDKYKVKWVKNKKYQYYLPTDFESKNGILYYIETEIRENGIEYYSHITKKEFDKYFIDIKEDRNKKIDIILGSNDKID